MTNPVNSHRRQLLAAGLSALLGSWLAPLWAGTQRPQPAGPIHSAQQVVGLFADRRSAEMVGLAYLAGHPAEADSEHLLRKILAGAPNTFDPLRSWLSAKGREDFAHGRTVQVQGWLLSQTEARRCALAALAISPPSRKERRLEYGN